MYWEHLHPEALYQFRVRDFGPLTVSMDSHGNHKYFDVRNQAKKRIDSLFREKGWNKGLSA